MLPEFQAAGLVILDLHEASAWRARDADHKVSIGIARSVFDLPKVWL